MVYCHGLLSQITLYWCYQHWNYGLLLDGFLRHGNIWWRHKKDKTNPIRRYYVVPIVIAIASIIYFIQI